jgi:hypothetical protein
MTTGKETREYARVLGLIGGFSTEWGAGLIRCEVSAVDCLNFVMVKLMQMGRIKWGAARRVLQR